MKTIVEFPSNDTIEDEALVWLIRLDGDRPLNRDEEREFEIWLARSPVHRDMLKSLNSFWAKSNVLNELMEPESLFALYRQRLLALFWPLNGVKMGVAASLFMVLTLGLLVTRQDITDSNGLYVTAVGQQKTITLADASQLQLNTNSQIQVDYNQGHRNIRLLQGEVYFDVAKDASRPFRVYAGSGRVQAVGTAFNVYLKQNDVAVFVTEGRVALASTLPPIPTQARAASAESYDEPDPYAETAVNGLGAYSAGQGVTLKNSQLALSQDQQAGPPQSAVEVVPLSNASQQKPQLAWRQGLLIFTGESLEEVIAEVSRYTTVAIDIVDPELRDIAIGGQIQVSDPNSMFSALEASFGLKIQRLSYNRVQVVAHEQP